MIKTWWYQLMQKSHLMTLPVHLRHNSHQTRKRRQTPQCDVTKSTQSHPFKGRQGVGNIHASPTDPCKANVGSLVTSRSMPQPVWQNQLKKMCKRCMMQTHACAQNIFPLWKESSQGGPCAGGYWRSEKEGRSFSNVFGDIIQYNVMPYRKI